MTTQTGTAPLSARITQNNEKHTKLMVDAKAIMDQYQGVETPAEKQAELDRIFADADAVQGETKGMVAELEKKSAAATRLAEHEEYLRGSAGQLRGMGGGGSAASEKKALGPVEQKAGWYGVETKAGFVEVYTEEEVEASAEIKASLTPEYKAAFRRYLKAQKDHMISSEDWDTLNGASAKALTEGTDSAGGFLVPIQMVAQLIMRKPGAVVMGPDRATVIGASSDRILIPRVKAATSDATMYSSAVIVTDVGETPAEGTGETEPVFEMVGVNIHMLKAFTKLSRNLVADSAFSVETLLSGEFGTAIALGKDDRFLTGNGVNQPTGVVNDSAITSIVSGSASTLTPDGIKDLVYGIPAQYQGSSTIVMSLSALKVARKLKDSQNRYLWEPGFGGIIGGAPPTLEGRPYMVTDFLDAVAGSAKPLFIGDLSAFWIVERPMFALEVLRELYAPQNMFGYQIFHRYSSVVTNPAAFAVQTVST